MNRRIPLNAVVFGLTLVSLGLALAAAYRLLNDQAVYTGLRVVEDPQTHTPVTLSSHASLVQINGEGVIPKVLFPVVLVLVAVVLPQHKVRIFATALLWAFMLVASMSIGLYYFPAAAAMLLATVCGRSASTG